MTTAPMTARELIAKAAACHACGREHEPRWTGDRHSWASPEDGHPYWPVMDVAVVSKLRGLMRAER